MEYIDEDQEEAEEEEEDTICIAAAIYYAERYLFERVACRDSALSGAAYVMEVLNGHRTRFRELFRMDRSVYDILRSELTSSASSAYYLRPTSTVSVDEQLAIFLYIVGQDQSNRSAQERFQHSGETISRYNDNQYISHFILLGLPRPAPAVLTVGSGGKEVAKAFFFSLLFRPPLFITPSYRSRYRHFHAVLDALYKLSPRFIRLPPENGDTPAHIASNPKFYPYFKNCRMALDGSHVPARVPIREATKFRNRKGFLSQNVLCACDFDMMFTYVLAGWSGSAHDGRVLADARSKDFATPQGKYDLGDAGYALSLSLMTPYRGVRYHLKEWGQGNSRYACFPSPTLERRSSTPLEMSCC